MVVIDMLSKFAYFIPLPTSHTTQMVAEVLTQNILKIHGILYFIVSYRDKFSLVNFDDAYSNMKARLCLWTLLIVHKQMVNQNS